VQTVELREMVRGLAGRTVVLSTHILSEAASLCTRVAILKEGRLLAVDTPEELARRVERAGGIVLRVDGPAAEVERVLASLPGVLAVTVTADGGGTSLFRLATAHPEPVQRVLAATIVGHGWTLLEVRMETPTLEELFMQLVG
jgi:ABC-2 type transport system ATP-binding protein